MLIWLSSCISIEKRTPSPKLNYLILELVFKNRISREKLKTKNNKLSHAEFWVSIQLLTLCFNFLVYFEEMSSYYSMKAHKRNVRKCLKSVKEFLHRSDLVNRNFVITVLKTKLLLVLITVDFITILCFFRDDHLHLKLVISC